MQPIVGLVALRGRDLPTTCFQSAMLSSSELQGKPVWGNQTHARNSDLKDNALTLKLSLFLDLQKTMSESHLLCG